MAGVTLVSRGSWSKMPCARCCNTTQSALAFAWSRSWSWSLEFFEGGGDILDGWGVGLHVCLSRHFDLQIACIPIYGKDSWFFVTHLVCFRNEEAVSLGCSYHHPHPGDYVAVDNWLVDFDEFFLSKVPYVYQLHLLCDGALAWFTRACIRIRIINWNVQLWHRVVSNQFKEQRKGVENFPQSFSKAACIINPIRLQLTSRITDQTCKDDCAQQQHVIETKFQLARSNSIWKAIIHVTYQAEAAWSPLRTPLCLSWAVPLSACCLFPVPSLQAFERDHSMPFFLGCVFQLCSDRVLVEGMV